MISIILNEILFIPSPLMIALIIAGISFLVIITLYNLSNPVANKIKYYLNVPFKSKASNPQVTEFFNTLHNRIQTTDLSIVKKLFIKAGDYIKRCAARLNKFENIYLNNFLSNLEDFVSLAGLVSRKIQDVNIKTYTAYLLCFIVLFYFIFRTM